MLKINGRIFALWLAVVLAVAPVLPVSTVDVYAQMQAGTSAVSNAPVQAAELRGFEGQYALPGNPNEIVEIIVQFRTPSSFEMQNQAAHLGRVQPGASFEEQALLGHAAFLEQLNRLHVPFGGGFIEIFGEMHRVLNGMYMRVPAGMVAQIAGLPEVLAIEPHIIPVQPYSMPMQPIGPHSPAPNTGALPFPPFFDNPLIMANTRAALNLNHVHNVMGITGNGVRVAMLDSGIYHNHPEFIRFQDPVTNRIRGWPYAGHAYDGQQSNHGTQTAGSIIAMAPYIELWSFQKLSTDWAGNLTPGLPAIQLLDMATGIVPAFDIIYTWGAWIHHPFTAHAQAVTNAIDNGFIVVAAAHNVGPDPFTVAQPLSPLAITVGAGTFGSDFFPTDTDNVPDFSGRGPVEETFHIKPDIIALGEWGFTTWDPTDAFANPTGELYDWFSGTSLAGPLTTGIVALLVEQFGPAHPSHIKARLMNSAREITGTGGDSVFSAGAGFVNPYVALRNTVFATVTHHVPISANRDVPFQPRVMASLSFGLVETSASSTMTITMHGSTAAEWTPAVVWNSPSACVSLNLTPSGNTFSAQMFFDAGTSNGFYEGNIIFTRGTDIIRMPFAANFQFDPAAQPHPITLVGGGTGASVSPNPAAAGAQVTVNAGTRENYNFANWTTSPAGLVTFTPPNATPATFSMIGEPLTVVANWTQVVPGGPITNLVINVTAPATGATPSATATGGDGQWTATVEWFSNPPAGSTFSANTVYRAEITITPIAPWTMAGVANPGFTVPGSTANTVTRDGYVVSAVFPVTAAIPEGFVPVSNITLNQLSFQTGEAVNLNNLVEVHPISEATNQNIIWTFHADQPYPAVPANHRNFSPPGVLNVTQEGNVRVTATIVGGGPGGTDFVRHFILTFTSGNVTVTHDMNLLHVGVPVNGNITFTLTGNMPTEITTPWHFANPITAADFFVTGLPPGLTAGTAVRVSDNIVTIPVTGTPTTVANTQWRLTVPTHLPARNFRFATLNKTVVGAATLYIGPVSPSAVIVNDAFTFDLNPHGEMHRDVLLIVELRGHALSSIRFGAHTLVENQDFFRFANGIMISSTFLNRMIVGTWEVTVVVTGAGANPVFHVTVIDSRVMQQVPPVVPPIDPGDFPTPPITPHHPDETFIHLSGGQFVDIMNLNFAQDRARVAPAVIHGEATTTIRANIFEEMGRRLPGQRFEIASSLTRLFVPTDFLDITHGARAAIAASGLGTHQVDVRIRQIDRSGDTTLITRFNNTYPGGLILSPLSELRVELVNSATGAVIFTASEFTRPLEMIHAVLQPGAHLRPAGMFFHPQRIEYAPFRTFSPNEISIISRFTGVHGVMQNATHFIDLPLDHWAFEQAWTAAYSGIVIARGPLFFQTQISRGEFAQMLAFALQLPRAGVTSSGFSDVPASHPMFDGISRLNAAGLLWLWDGHLFHPNAAITREEMAAIVGSAIVIGNPIRDPITRPINVTWPDGNQVSTRLITAVQTAVNYQLIIGYPDGTLRPHAPGIRAYATELTVNTARLLGLLDPR